MGHRIGALALCTLSLAWAWPAAADAARVRPATPTAAVAQSAPPVPVAAPAPARLTLTVEHTFGRPAFALAGVPLILRGGLFPYVAGQSVALRIFRHGRRVLARSLRVRPGPRGGGVFVFGYASARGGTIRVELTHPASATQLSASIHPAVLRVLRPDVGPGSVGPVVRALQHALGALHYAGAGGGSFNDATARALTAFRKLTRAPQSLRADARVFTLLARGAGAFPVRYRRDGKHIEADLSRQVLAEIDPGGRVRRIYTTSSGKPSTPTVIGHFHVYLKTRGVNQKGMVDSNYFIGGYAIHGYPDVPNYAASHGCLRIPVPDAAAMFGWLRIGDAVDVYTDGHGGSRAVRPTAGP